MYIYILGIQIYGLGQTPFHNHHWPRVAFLGQGWPLCPKLPEQLWGKPIRIKPQTRCREPANGKNKTRRYIEPFCIFFRLTIELYHPD